MASPRLPLLALLALGTTGCETMRHENLDQDIPSTILADYSVSAHDYVDEAVFWFPLLLSQTGEIGRVKDGFTAELHTSLGPLGLPVSTTESARYDADGRVQRYSGTTGYLWGFLARHGSREDRVQHRETTFFDVLFGLVGHRTRSDGMRTFYFLWIPIPMSRGAGDD